MARAGSPQKRPSSIAEIPPPRPQPLLALDGAETADHEYALVSVLYHALQGAQACEQYVGDAERGDDPELVKFFRDCIQEQQQRAARAKQLLAGRIETEGESYDDDEDSGA